MISSFGTLIRMLLVVACIPATSFAFQEDSVIEQFGRMLGGALRGEPVAQPVFAGEAVMEFDAAPNPAIGEAEKEETKKRITAYSDAMFQWVVQTCEIPEADHPKIRELFEAGVQKQCEAAAKRGRRNLQQAQQVFPGTFPLFFTMEDAIASDFRDNLLKQLAETVLSDPQKQKLNEAMKEREDFRLQAFAEFLTALLDKELFLTEQQRLQFVEKMRNAKKPVKHTLYSFQPQSYYVPYEAMSQLLSRVSAKDVLDASQRKRLTDLNGSDPNNQVNFQAADGMESWHSQMDQLAKKQRDVFLRAAAVRVTWFEKELQLSPEQVTTLNHASKGAAVRALGDWKEQTQQTLDQMEQQMAQMGGNFGFGAQTIDGTAVDSNPVWTDNLKSITEGKAAERMKQRRAQQNEVIAKCLIALFDDELWLTPSQRTSLHPIFVKSLPKAQDNAQQNQFIREIVWLAFPLFKSDKTAREAVLSEAQRAAWDQMASFYDYQKSNEYVQIQMRNHGGSFGFMLNQ